MSAIAEFIHRFRDEYRSPEAYELFLKQYPDYLDTIQLTLRRIHDFARLDATGAEGDVYLDFTGAGLYGQSQLRSHVALLESSVLGNPHSANPSSQRATEEVERARQAVLAFFNASPDEYCVVFTANATGAAKLVAEAYPFGPTRPLCYLVDDHNSIVGMREIAKAKDAAVMVPLICQPELRIDADSLNRCLASPGREGGLFAYPAQSNFTGVQHSLDWIERAQRQGWTVLLDAAAFVPTNQLDLSRYHPDFVCLSFYKIFGWPTGVGCLIVRKPALGQCKRPWFAGGTVDYVSAQGDHHKMAEGVAGFEDGTVDFLGLPGVRIGLEYTRQAGISQIHTRVMCLTGWMLDQLSGLRHSNGAPLVSVYGPSTIMRRGATIALNLLTPEGRIVDERVVQQAASDAQISLRAGCFCDPGAGEIIFGIDVAQLRDIGRIMARPGVTQDELLQFLNLQSGGAIRVSFGSVSTFRDAERFLALVAGFRDGSPDASALPPRRHC
jgi:selenocysteine lyase/cysteine desulfurase